MATLAASSVVSSAGLTFFAGGPISGIIGLAIVGAAGYLDRKVIGSLLKQDAPKGLRLAGLPTTTFDNGSPRVWAMGRKVRVPVHVLYQSDKRLGGGGGGKTSTPEIQRVLADAVLLLNDRPTEGIAQLTANGNLLLFGDRNVVEISTTGMVATTTNISGQDHLVLTMTSGAELSFTAKFVVDDVVQLRRWFIASGPNINVGYWKVHALTDHASGAFSSITLRPYSSQTLTSLNATAGDITSPALIERVDDRAVGDGWGYTVVTHPSTAQPVGLRLNAPGMGRKFLSGSLNVVVTGITPAPTASGVMRLDVNGEDGLSLWALPSPQNTPLASGGPFTIGSSTSAAVIAPNSTANYAIGTFATDPALYFQSGTEDQEESDIIASHETSGTIPGFRGAAVQGLDDWDLSPVGNSIPLVEALLEPDPDMTLPQGLLALMERGGIEREEVDISRVSSLPLDGFYIRGTASTAQALQPLLLVYGLLTQERDGRLVFFHTETADVVQVENGPNFTDLGAYVGRDTPNQSDKIRHGQLDVNDLPTSVGVRYQDPDNLYAAGFQSFGLRAPTAISHQNVQEVDASNMVLGRRQARDAAATILRRTWVNAHTVEVSLPAAYLDLCENDLITVTDDDGNDITARVIRREVGRNFLVNVLAVREELDLAVSGSPVQTVAGTGPLTLPGVGDLDFHVLDIAPLLDEDMWSPGLYLCAASRTERWAGALVYISFDGGTNYALAGTLHTEHMTGMTTTSLDAGAVGEDTSGGPYWDTTNTVEVELYGEGVLPLASQSSANVLAGWNWFLIGDEILGAQTVTQTGTNTYELSDLLRGIRGTYHECEDDKDAGQRVVGVSFFNLSGIHYKLPGGRNVPATVHLKAVPSGRTLADVTAVEVEVEGWNCRPFPVRDFACTIGGSPYDATFTFSHWSRRNYPVGYTGPYELDETVEAYDLRIYDPTNTTLMRTKTIRADGAQALVDAQQAFVYTAAEQTADGYTPGPTETFWIEFVQVGDYGEGRTWRQEVP